MSEGLSSERGVLKVERSMTATNSLPDDLQAALDKGLLKRFPLTFLPFINQQLREWQFLFPNERRSVARLLFYVASLNEEQSSVLFHDVRAVEEKMGVRHWQLSTSEQTIQNSSELARSPYFQEWRSAVQTVFDAADKHEVNARETTKRQNRLVLLDIPQSLPIQAQDAWKRWGNIGRTVTLSFDSSEQMHSPMGFLLSNQRGPTSSDSSGLLEARNHLVSAADIWIVDAGRSVIDAVLATESSTTDPARAILLSYNRLDAYRQAFSHEMNSMRKDLADADAVFARMRKLDVIPWCPPEVAADPAVREFLRSLYLSGNGAVIFGNSFVEWAASEAFRRARPHFLAASFGLRSKPKPFTSVAVFENPDQVNPLPAVDDLTGSALDAQVLSLYVWLAASRYEEYQHSTICVCLAESIAQAYIVAPPEFSLLPEQGPVPLDRMRDALVTWMN
jgi:hypothetical protein